jgi:hypothetical protein
MEKDGDYVYNPDNIKYNLISFDIGYIVEH